MNMYIHQHASNEQRACNFDGGQQRNARASGCPDLSNANPALHQQRP
jgi:hypothetical protein